MTRQARDRRRGRTHVQLTRRDGVLLGALSRWRVARTTDVLDYAFAEIRRDTAARRLRRLFDAGFLEVRSGSRSEENLYSLGPQGRTWMQNFGREVGSVPRGDVAHHLAIVRAWIDLALLAHADSRLRIQVVRPDWEIREAVGNCSGVIPDLLVGLERSLPSVEAVAIRCVFEIDLGTEPLSILIRKFRTYEGLRGSRDGLFGWKDFSLFVVAPRQGATRRKNIARLLDECWTGRWAVVAGRSDLRTAVEALSQLQHSPYHVPLRKGRVGEATDGSAVGSLTGNVVL